MTISAKILADSINEFGERLTTFELTYPRFIHSQVMTHRAFSRNASSSRAMPVRKVLDEVKRNPAMPSHWGKNQAGMQARVELNFNEIAQAKRQWLDARDSAVFHVEEMLELGVHKQVANRILEPWAHINVILTGTDFGNFYNLRAHDDAQPEIEELAKAMLKAQNESVPVRRGANWHLPLVTADEQDRFSSMTCMKLSVARCARVSYKNHDGTHPDINKDLDLCESLLEAGHMSPFEHQARAASQPGHRTHNLVGWVSYRAGLPNENRAHFKGLAMPEVEAASESDGRGSD